MDKELNDLLSGLMSDPSAMETLGGLLSSLGGTPSSAPTETKTETGDGAFLGKLLPLLAGGAVGGDSREVALLRALRPYLHDGREKRLDEAIEWLRIIKLLPLITGKGGTSHGE